MEGSSKSNIQEHRLLEKALEELKPLLESISPEVMALESSRERHSKAPKLSEAQSYHHYVFWYAKNMVQAFKWLDHVTTYMKDFPKPQTYLKRGITQYDWVQYHYHIYLIIAISLYDIALKLANAVFRLGLEERQVGKGTIEDNLWVKRIQVSKLLCNLRNATSRLKAPRNLFVHEGDLLRLDELDRLDVICMANKLDVTREYPADRIKSLFKSEIDKVVDEMSRNISSLQDMAVKLFDGLLPIYESWATFLKNVDKSKET